MLFDVNQVSGIAVFMQPADRSLVQTLLERAPRKYRRVVVTNTSADTRDVESRTAEPGVKVGARALGLAWPPEMFSLTHVAIPFAPNDPFYGIDRSGGLAGLLPLGRLSPRGERAVLTMGTERLMRLSSNPFFPFVAERIAQWVALDAGGASYPEIGNDEELVRWLPASGFSRKAVSCRSWMARRLRLTASSLPAEAGPATHRRI